MGRQSHTATGAKLSYFAWDQRTSSDHFSSSGLTKVTLAGVLLDSVTDL